MTLLSYPSSCEVAIKARQDSINPDDMLTIGSLRRDPIEKANHLSQLGINEEAVVEYIQIAKDCRECNFGSCALKRGLLEIADSLIP